MKYHIELDIEFKKNPYKGRYIAVEGIDGSGKSTQVNNLIKYFEKEGKSVVVTSEPRRDSLVGKLIHEILRGKVKVPPTILQYLYSADRLDNQETVILPALENGKIVISHRSFWSVIPYGMLDKGFTDYKKANILFVVQGLLSLYHQFTAPDYTFYLNVSVDTAVKRLAKMSKIKEIYERREKLEKINDGYLWLARQFPSEILIINGEKETGKVTEEILSRIKK